MQSSPPFSIPCYFSVDESGHVIIKFLQKYDLNCATFKLQLCCCVHLILYLTLPFSISLLDDIRICNKDLLQHSQVTIYFKASPRSPALFRSNSQKSLALEAFAGPLSCFWKQVPLCSYYAFKFYSSFLNYMLISKNVKLREKLARTTQNHSPAL